MKQTKYGICPICGSCCGLKVELEDGRITAITGDRQDPHSRGYACPKGRSLMHQHTDPDRVLTPLHRQGADWVQTSWDASLEDIASQIARIRRRHGPRALALYAGDGTTHSYETLFAIAAFVTALNIKNLYTANSMDALPRLFASKLLYGSSSVLPIPDVKRTNYLLILGANPVVSNGSVMTAPGFSRYIRDIQARGGRVVVVDPRRNETAEIAGEHLFIRPESDVYFLLAMLNVIFEEGLSDAGRLTKRITGLGALKRAAREFSPERAAALCGVPARDIRRLARDFAAAPGAVCYGRMGACAQSFGTTASLLIDALNIVTGNLDRPGGAMFTTPAVDMGTVMSTLGMNGAFAKNRTRVKGLPDFNGEMPCAALADEIEAPDGIRALIVVGGNPAVSVPDSARLCRAFGKLDLMVSLDPYINATSCHAHYLLPPAIGLEHEVYPLMVYDTAVHNAAKWAAPVLAPPPTVRYDAAILGELLCRILGHAAHAPRAVSRGLMALGRTIHGQDILRLLLRLGPHNITLDDLKRNPHGLDLGPLEPCLEKKLGRNGRITLAPPLVKKEFARIAAAALEQEQAAAGNPLDRSEASDTGDNTSTQLDDAPLILTSRRQLRFFNTSLRNVHSLVTGPEQCVLEIHPRDAAPRGIADGGPAVLETDTGTGRVTAHVTDRIMPGVISLPFGWNGPQPAARQSVLNAHPGFNVNTITDRARIDPLSAMTAFNGTRVRVRSGE